MHFGDRQTNEETEEHHRCIEVLALTVVSGTLNM